MKSPYVGQNKTLKIDNKVYFLVSAPWLFPVNSNAFPLKVAPEIIGGIIVEIGERTIDLSVSAKMAKLNKLLTDAL